jgi:GNAT superfamily N-acetyltransferase
MLSNLRSMKSNIALEDKCDSFLYSEAIRPERRLANAYMANIIGHPDPESEFGKNLGNKKYLFRTPFIGRAITPKFMSILKSYGHDVLLLRYESQLIGHTAFQCHETYNKDIKIDVPSLHVFSVVVNEGYRKQNLATLMQEEIIKWAKEQGIQKVRLGAGGHYSMSAILKRFSDWEERLNVRVEENNLIDLLQPEGTKYKL